jgi:hypothetical protein
MVSPSIYLHMNFLEAKTTWTNMEFAVLKICLASAYVVIGSYFSEYVRAYYTPLVALFGVTLFWTLFLWLRKMQKTR